MKGKWTAIIILILVVRMIVSLAGCGKQDSAKKETKNPAPAVTEKAKNDENPNIKKVDPNSIDKATLDYYKEIARKKGLSEQELRGIVAHLLEIGLGPDRLGKDNHGRYVVKPKTDEVTLDRNISISFDQNNGNEVLGRVDIGALRLYDKKPLHTVDEITLSKDIYIAMIDEARKRANRINEKNGYKFLKDSKLNDEGKYWLDVNVKDGKQIIGFVTRSGFIYRKEVYGNDPVDKSPRYVITCDKTGKVLKFTTD